MDIDFLSVGEVIELHREAIRTYGGTSGIRDLGRLEAAVGAPQSGSGDAYYHEDVWEMAAAYLFHIVQGHPFIDGNKRAGLMAANTFLRMNDLAVIAEEDTYADLVLAIAAGSKGKSEAATFFRQFTTPVSHP
ncbi:MAG TPA: type II toxin-antitoxin system death-on-curing family toxin [Candidatus Limnocylindria bacterium]|jgi:death-on-curing protein